MTEQIHGPALQGERLHIDPRTALIGLWRRRFLLVAFVVVSCAMGVLGGIMLGKRTFEAETALLYKPVTDPKNPAPLTPINTFANMVKVQSNLDELNRKLNLDASPLALDKGCEVVVEKNSDLLIIRAQWKTAKLAADIANGLRDIFLEQHIAVRRTEAAKELHDLEERLEAIRGKLKAADAALHQFTTANKVINLDKETQSYLEELASMDLAYENAQVEKTTVDQKAANLDRIAADLRKRIQDEAASSAEKTQKLYEMNIRIERLRDAIHEDQNVRASIADLAQKELDLEHAKKLKDEGVISQVEYEKAVNAYQKQKALAVDTQQIKTWRTEMDKLHQSVLPDAGSTPTAPVLKEIMIKEFDIQIERAAATEKVKKLEAARNRIKEKVEALPKLQREYVDLSREVSSRDAEKQSIETLLTQARRISESQTGDFGVASKATPPAKPVRSTRTLLCMAIAAVGSLMGLAFVVALEVLDTTIKSGAEFSLRLSVPLFGAIPRASGAQPVFPDKSDFAPMEAFRIIARRIRSVVPKKGARVLIVSAEHGEGRTVVAANLAASFGRQDERALVIDGQLRPKESAHELRGLIAEAGASLKGLGEYLSFEADKSTDVIWPTLLPGVECLPRIGTSAIPDHLGSNRMRDLLEEVSGQYTLVLVDVPPALHYADAEALAPWADAVIFVVGSRMCRASLLQKTMDRLTAAKAPIVGAILNAVDHVYLEGRRAKP